MNERAKERLDLNNMESEDFMGSMKYHARRAVEIAKDPNISIQIAAAHVDLIHMLEEIHLDRFGFSALMRITEVKSDE